MTRKKSHDEAGDTLVQILDGDGNPVTPKMTTSKFTETCEKISASLGHNSGISGERLTSIIKRIERLMGDRDAVNDDIKEVYSEAKSIGFETKIIRKVIAERRMDEEKRREQA